MREACLEQDVWFFRLYKPLVKEMGQWPTLRIDSSPCPFDKETSGSQKHKGKILKRKLRQSGQFM